MTPSPTLTSGLVVDGVSKSYGATRALDEVSFTIAPGSTMGLLGRNGAGKTTLMSIIAGLRSSDAGHVRVCGADVIRQRYAARAHLGYASQDVAVYPTLSVRQNLAFFCQVLGLAASAMPGEVERACELLGLGQLVDRRVGTLSGGERRRVHTAVALLGRPGVLLLDEVSAGLDIEGRELLLAAIRAAAADGAAVCYCSHHPVEIESLGGDVAVLESGRLLAWGPVTDVVKRHAHGALEVSFDRRVAGVEVPGGRCLLTRDDESGVTFVFAHPEPAAAAAGLLARLRPEDGLASVRVMGAHLEAAYLALANQAFPSTP